MIVSRDELKYIHTNTIRCANRDATKFAKVHGAIMLGGEGNKPMIALNIDGISIWPSQNRWHKTLKSHIFQHLDICKSIDIHVVEKMEKVKADLEKQLKFPELGLNFEHMKFTTRKIMKTRHGDWLKVY